MARSEGMSFPHLYSQLPLFPRGKLKTATWDSGLALAPWDVLVAGRLRSDTEEQARKQSGENGRMMYRDTWERNEEEANMAEVLEEIARECGLGGAESTSSEGGGMAVAIAYVMQKTTHVFPILGGHFFRLRLLHATCPILH